MNEFSLSAWLATRYDLAGPVEVTLLRSYTNDVYRVEAGGERFVLKVYGQGWRTEGEIRYEAALLHHLSARGLPIAAPIPPVEGDAVAHLVSEEGERFAILFTLAPGEKPSPPFTPSLYEAFGAAIARMHTLSDDFYTPFPRRALDLACLIADPAALVLPLLYRSADRDFFAELCETVTERIAALTADKLDWGPIHGDATLDNLHVTADGEIVLYDFDSGGPGWRAADLQGWAVGSAEYAERWTAFKRGYSQIRPIRDADLAAAPYLTLAWDIWGIQIDLERRILRQGSERTEAYLREQMGMLRERG